MKVLLLASPYDSGHYQKRLGKGPGVLSTSAARHLSFRGHNVRSHELQLPESFNTEVTTSFQVSRAVANAVHEAVENSELPVVFTGNCNAAAVGTISGLRNEGGVVWFDCHGDFNTPETTIGGFLDGMAMAMVAGHCWSQLTASVPGYRPVPENRIMLLGFRDLDPLEEKRLLASEVQLFTPEQIAKPDFTSDDFKPNVESVYLHVDLDVLDPGFVKANMFSTGGGLYPDDLFKAVRAVAKKYRVAGIGFTSYDPTLDPERKVSSIVNGIIDIVIPT